MDLTQYDYILVNSSAGKDSQTALRVVVSLAREQGVLDRVIVAHADLGRMEWKGVKELAWKQAAHYGLDFHVVRRRTAEGREETLLDYVRRRGKWPSSTTRYCTSEFKRSPCQRVITMLARRAREASGRKSARILNVFGFRAEESPARAKRPVFALNERASTTLRADGSRATETWDWLPIHEWTTEAVWQDIRESGVPYHPAYDLGMPRLSCCFCIFAPKAALMIAGKANPELLQEYVDLEREIGHDFQHNKPIRAIQEALASGEAVGAVENWTM